MWSELISFLELGEDEGMKPNETSHDLIIDDASAPSERHGSPDQKEVLDDIPGREAPY